MHCFAHLPNELLDIILREYWLDFFRMRVISHLNQEIGQLKHIRQFYCTHQWALMDDPHAFSSTLLEMNHGLERIYRSRGLFLFLKSRFGLCTTLVDTDVSPYYFYILQYLLGLSGSMRYNLLHALSCVSCSDIIGGNVC